MKTYKKNDIVVVRKKITDNWGDSWLDEMDEYIGNKSVVIKVEVEKGLIHLLLEKLYNRYFGGELSLSYAFPIKSLDNRLEKLKRILDDED